MTPTVKAIAYGIVSLAAFILAFWWAYAALDRAPQGCHAREDAPTLGDVLADWLRDRAAILADDIAHWEPLVRTAAGRVWLRHRFRVKSRRRTPVILPPCDDHKLRASAAAACASPDGTAPDPASGAVPLEVRVTSSDGFPAVAFRAGHPPWETAGQPRLPEMRP